MGVVFKARQINLNRIVAIKLVHAGALASQDLIKRFKAEAEAAAALNHPNIVPIFEIGEVQGQHYFSMGLVNGPNLDTSLKSNRLPPRKAAELLVLLARAVNHAHQHGVLHRDIKPSNILIDQDGTPYLTDFGLAKFAQKDSTLTHTNAIMGTPSYMAPEQARGETKNVTTAADVYGLGAVLYTCLSGQPPFAGGTTFETIRQVLENEPRRPSSLNSVVDRDLDIVCLKCLAKDPSKRYASAEAVAADLARWLGSEPIEARPATTYDRLQKWVRRRPTVAALTALSILLLLIAGIGGAFYSLRLKTAALILEENLYAAEMGVAFAEWSRGNASLPRELLESNRPRGKRDLRGFEWYYLDALCQPKELFSIPRQTNQIFGLACSPDSKLVAAAQMNKTIRLIDLVARRDVGILEGVPAGYSLAFDKTGKRLLSSSFEEGILPIWDVDRRSIITNLPVSGQVLSAVFSPDGNFIVSSTGDLYDRSKPGEIALWSAITYQRLHTFPRQAAAAWEVAFSPDSRLLATAQGDGTIALWNSDSRALVRTVEAHANIVSAIAFSPDGKFLASGSLDEAVSLWTVADFRQIPIGRHERVDSVVFSRDGKWLASSARDQTIKIWNIEDRRAKPILLRGHSGRIWAIDSTADGRYLVSGCVDGDIKVWDWNTIAHEIPSPIRTKLDLIFSDDSEVNLSDTKAGTLVLKVPSEEMVANLPIEGAIFSPDGREILGLARGTTNTLVVFDRGTLREKSRIFVGHETFPPFQFSPDGKHLVVRGPQDSFELRNREKDWAVESVRKLPAPPHVFNFSTDGRYLAALCPESRTASVFGLSHSDSGHVLHLPMPSPNPLIAPAVWIPKIHTMIIGGDRPVVQLRDLDTGEIRTLKLGAGPAWALAVSPDARTLAVGSQDGFIQLINIRTLRVMATLRGHLTNIQHLSFSPDGTMLLSKGGEGAYLWSARKSAGRL